MTESKKVQDKILWTYIGLPFRPAYGTYDTWEDLPTVPKTELAKFEKIKTIRDLQDNLTYVKIAIGTSVTACYFNFLEEDMFYRDQQDCVVWYFNESIGVYYLQGEGQMMVVSSTLAEFLARISLENRIWKKSAKTHFHLLHGPYDKSEKIDKVKEWTALSKLLADEELEYLQVYYDKF